MREELDRGRIVVLAGFQGVNPVTKGKSPRWAEEAATPPRSPWRLRSKPNAVRSSKRSTEFVRPIRASWRIQNPCVGWILHRYPKCVFGAPRVLHFRSVELAQSQNVPLVLKKWGGGAEHSTQVMREELRGWKAEKSWPSTQYGSH